MVSLKLPRVILIVLVMAVVLPDLTVCRHRSKASRRKSIARAKTSSMRNRMKEVLHLRDDNSLTSMFNMNEENPAYVFVLPDKRNKTIVFHQSDFTEMEYPKISEVGRSDVPKLKAINATILREAETNKTVPLAERLIIKDNDYEDEDYSDEAEAEMNRIVEENVRTERNFIQYMEDLNESPRPATSAKSLKAHPSKASSLHFKHYGDQFHPDLFHNPEDLLPLEEVVRPPPPPVPEDQESLEELRSYRSNKNKKVKKNPGFPKIGEVVQPPFNYDEAASRSEEYESERKIVPKLKSVKKSAKPSKESSGGAAADKEFVPPSNVFETRKQESHGGWDDLGLDGWSGGLSDVVHEFEEKVEQPPTSDIFNQGQTYDEMKDMFHKHVEYSYRQTHPPPPYSTIDPFHPANPTRGTKTTAWRGVGPSSYHNQQQYRPSTGLKTQYSASDEEEDDDEDDDEEEQSRDEFQEHRGDYSHHRRPPPPPQFPTHYPTSPRASEEEATSVEYVPPRIRTNYGEQQQQGSSYSDEEDEKDGPSFHNNGNSVDDEDDEGREYVYMINGKPISLELARLLQDEHMPLNLTRHVKISLPKWPITNSRSNHRDADIFVGRANNPFGHSTKWKWSNSSASYVVPPLPGKKQKKDRDGRYKRGVTQLYSMVKCATGCDPIIYKGYGCYCGFLGQGEPLDGIDKCCKAHDTCYLKSKCPEYLEYFVPYLWKCYKGTPLCAVSHGEWGGANSCAARLCQCDLKLSMCLRRYYCPRKRNVCTSSPWRLLQNFIMDF